MECWGRWDRILVSIAAIKVLFFFSHSASKICQETGSKKGEYMSSTLSLSL